MTLNHLSHTQVEQIVTCVTDGKTLPHEVLVQIVAKTDGVPLFVEELTKAILESGHLNEVDGHYELMGSFSTFAIPATLQDSLMARLDRLVTAKAVAQYAAVIGRQFAYDGLPGEANRKCTVRAVAEILTLWPRQSKASNSRKIKTRT